MVMCPLWARFLGLALLGAPSVLEIDLNAFLVALAGASTAPYGLDYYIAVGGELIAVFFGPAGQLSVAAPLLTDAGVLCQTLPYTVQRPPYRFVVEQMAYLRWQSNGSIAGVWDSAQKCFVSLESSSVPRTVFSPTDFSYSGDVYLSDLDLAFLQTALSKRASRFQCLQRVAYASSFAQCGYDSRMQLDMSTDAGAVAQALTIAKTTGDLQSHAVFLAQVAAQVALTEAARSATPNASMLLDARLAFLEASFEGLGDDASAILSGVWDILQREFAVIESDLSTLEAMWTAADIWDDRGVASFGDSRNASATFQALVAKVRTAIDVPPANFSASLHAALTDNMINYTVSLIDRLFYFGTLDGVTAPLLQLELETFAKMLTGHYYLITLDSHIMYRAYVQAISGASEWDTVRYIDAYDTLVFLAEFFYSYMEFYINDGPYTECLVRKMSEFSRVDLRVNDTDRAADGASFPGLFTGLYPCRQLTTMLTSAFFRFDGDAVTDVNLQGRAWELAHFLNLSLLNDVPSSAFYAGNSVLRLNSTLPSQKRQYMHALPSPAQAHPPYDAAHLRQLQRQSRQSWSETCPPGLYRNASALCDACPVGTFSPGDGLLHLCYNAPTDNATYTATRQVSADCAFVCLEADKYRSGNSCALIPTGFASLDGGGLAPCTTPYGAAFARFLSPGGRAVDGCAHTLAYQAVVEAAGDTGGFVTDFLFTDSFTLELWMRWRPPTFPSALQSLTIGLLGVPGLWSWELRLANASILLAFHMDAAAFPAPAVDASLLLDVRWHHLALVADAAQSAIVFYIDGRERGYGFYTPQLIRPTTSLPPTRLFLGGDRGEGREWLRADVDELRIHRARVPPPYLGAYSAAYAADLSCDSGDPQQRSCLAKCPAETSRNATLLAADLAPLSSPQDWSVSAFAATCRCPPGQEWYLSQCIDSCSGGAVRREWEECVCPEGQYQVWDATGFTFLYVTIARNTSALFSIAGIEVRDQSDAPLSPLACAAQDLPLSCPDADTSYTVPTNGTTLRLHLSDPRLLGAIIIRLTGAGASNSTISISLATSPTAARVSIATEVPGQQGANVFATRLFTPSSSPLLQCIQCPDDTTSTRYPRASLADCLCVSGTVRSGAACVPALPPLDAPIVSPPDGVSYPAPLVISLAFGGNSTADAYFVVSVIASRYYTVLLSPQAANLTLTEPSIVVASVLAPGRFPSLSTTKEFTVLPKAPKPSLYSPIPTGRISEPTVVLLSLSGAIGATTGLRFYTTNDGTDVTLSSPWVQSGQGIVIAAKQTLRARAFLPGYYLSDELLVRFPYRASSDTCWLCIFLPLGLVIFVAAVVGVVLRLWFWPQTVSVWGRLAAFVVSEVEDIWDCIDGDSDTEDGEEETSESPLQQELDDLYAS